MNPSGKAGPLGAKPGFSWHGGGAALDVAAMVKDKDGVWRGGAWHKNQRYLAKIMPLAGMVNYREEHKKEGEPWHWEYGSKRWKRKVGYKGKLYARTGKIDKLYKYG